MMLLGLGVVELCRATSGVRCRGVSGRGLPHQWCQVLLSEWPGFASPVVSGAVE